MKLLPPHATDEQLIAAIDRWVALLELEDYEGAYKLTSHRKEMGWTPELIRQVIKAYDEALPEQKVTVQGRSTDITQRKDVERFDEPADKGFVGYIWYDLNIDGVVSDLTATFDILEQDSGVELILVDIHVM